MSRLSGKSIDEVIQHVGHLTDKADKNSAELVKVGERLAAIETELKKLGGGEGGQGGAIHGLEELQKAQLQMQEEVDEMMKMLRDMAQYGVKPRI
jgi:hypothetical protein